MNTYFFAYDISNDKIRRRIVKLLKSYGHRHQKSVFVCQLKPAQAKKLFYQAKKMIKRRSDQVTLLQSSKIKSYPAQLPEQNKQTFMVLSGGH